MTTDDTHKAVQDAWLAKETKIEHGKRFLERKLREHGGPHPGQSAILIVNVIPTEVEGQGLVAVSCLPDLNLGALCLGLEKWIADVRAGNIEQEPHGLDDNQEKPQ
jgi:hypothetical protein